MLRLLFAFLLLSATAGAQPAVPATPAIPGQARPAVPVAPDSPSPPVLTNAITPQTAPALTIIADASLKQVLAALAQAWADAQDTGPQVPLTLTNAATLRSKVESGPGYDVVICADESDLKALADEGHLAPDSQRSLARNSIVVFGRKALLKEDQLDWFDLVGSEWKKVALGSPDTTASGRVAMRALRRHDLLGDDQKDVYLYAPTEALAAAQVQRDAADAVFLFKTDAARLTTPGFEALPISSDDAPPIFYVASIGRTAKNPAMARSFIDYCGTPDAKAIWTKFGFETN